MKRPGSPKENIESKKFKYEVKCCSCINRINKIQKKCKNCELCKTCLFFF